MAHKTTLTLILLALALVAAPASGKDEKGTEPKPEPAKKQGIQLRAVPGAAMFAVGGALTNPLGLLRNPKVQEELKLDEDQKTKIEEALQATAAERKELFAAVRGLQGDERQKKMAELQKKVQKKTAEASKSVRGALKPEQAKRLDQISLQMRGLRALSDPKVAEKLKLSDEQKQQIQEVAAAGQQKRIQLWQDIRNGQVERTKSREKSEEINKETENKTLDALTKEQKARFEKMKGAKFEMPQPRFQIQAVPFQPGQPRKIQIKPQQIQRKGNKIQIRVQAAPEK